MKKVILFGLCLILLGCSKKESLSKEDTTKYQQRCETVVLNLVDGKLDQLLEQSDSTLATVLDEQFDDIQKDIHTFGKLKTFSDFAVTPVKQNGKEYQVCILKVQFESEEKIFTISFDQDQLAGLYYK